MPTSKNRKSSPLKTILMVLVALVLVAGIVFLVGYTKYNNYLKPGSTNATEYYFTVEEDSSASQVIQKLYDEGFIQDVNATKLYVRLNHKENIFAGDFILKKNMSVQRIFDILTDESNVQLREVTIKIIPGDWAKDVAAKIAAVTDYKEEEIMAKWNDINYIDHLIETYDVITEDVLASEHCYLEGYFTPVFFNVFANSSIEEITETALDFTEEIFHKYEDDIDDSGLTIHQIYTLASMIQFESSNDLEDKIKVASVFHNRINDGWLLQSSVTVCYALYDDFHTWEDCETNPDINSPYNTYMYEGIPIGPVCNPNEDSIYAAIYAPKYPDYKGLYYFIANVNTGDMYFAETYAEHLYNIEHYMY